MELKVFRITGANAISIQSGQLLYREFIKAFRGGEEVTLNFADVELFASPFFNASVGLLLKDYELEEVLARLRIVNLSPIGKQLLNHVIANALSFYKEEQGDGSN